MSGPIKFVDPDEETLPPPAPIKREAYHQHYSTKLDGGRTAARRRQRDNAEPHGTAPLIGRMHPHSIEAEEYLLSCCFLDGRPMVQRCIDAHVEEKAFYIPSNQVIYAKLVEIYRRGGEVDLMVLAEELKTSRQLDGIGGYPYLTQISSRMPTTAQAGYFIERVLELHTLRELIRVSEQALEGCYAYDGGLEEFKQRVEDQLRRVLDATKGKQVFEAVGAMSFRYPTSDDPNSLLGHEDWLGRGGGMLFVSHAGAGKSSCIIDACMEWCRGRPFMGIPSTGNHKILIIQAEDSPRYIGKVIESYCAIHGLSEEERSHIDRHLLIVKVKGVQGEAFLQEVELQIRRHKPSLVVVNPVYLYIQGSVSDDETASAFLSGLDRVNACTGDNVGFILVHHTGKPPRANEEKRDTMDWETAYAGIGTSFWANWPRCSMLLEPRAEQGRYYLRLGKAGSNAGVVREYDMPDGQGGWSKVSEVVTKIPIKHSQQMLDVDGTARRAILWEPDTDAISDGAGPEEKKGAGNKKKELYSSEEICDYFPHSSAEGKKIAVIAREAREGCGIGDGTFYARREDLLERGWITESCRLYRRTAIGDDYVNAFLANRGKR